jgi:hypothetical protein
MSLGRTTSHTATKDWTVRVGIAKESSYRMNDLSNRSSEFPSDVSRTPFAPIILPGQEDRWKYRATFVA